MPKDFLQGAADEYDVIVIGSGLAGMTAANILGRAGHRVLLLEQHYKLGGMATWFKRPGGHIFDISLHGFPWEWSRAAGGIGPRRLPIRSSSSSTSGLTTRCSR
jgi:phytoene dehydrogenase-like protein